MSARQAAAEHTEARREPDFAPAIDRMLAGPGSEQRAERSDRIPVPAGTRPDAYALSIGADGAGLRMPPGSSVIVEPVPPTGAGLAVLYCKGAGPQVWDLTHNYMPDMFEALHPDSTVAPMVEACAPTSGRRGYLRADLFEKAHRVAGVYVPAEVAEKHRPLPPDLPLMHACPPGMGEHVVEDAVGYPLVRPRETVIYDPAQREPRTGALCVLEWQNGHRSLLQTNKRSVGSVKDMWWVDPVNRPTQAMIDRIMANRDSTGPVPILGHTSDGPYTEERLRKVIVGTVVGILVPGPQKPRGEAATQIEPPSQTSRADPDAALDPDAAADRAMADAGLTSEVSAAVLAAIEDHRDTLIAGRDEPDQSDEAFNRHAAAQDAADLALRTIPCRSLADLRAKLTYLAPLMAPDMLDKTHVAHLDALAENIEQLCRERSAPFAASSDRGLLLLGHKLDTAHAHWRRVEFVGRGAIERLNAALDAAKAQPGGPSTAAIRAAYDQPGVKDAQAREEAAFEALFPICDAIWKSPALTPAGVAVKARAALVHIWADGSFEDAAARGDDEDIHQRAARQLIEACCTLAGVDWRGDPIAPPLSDPVFPAIEQHIAAVLACNRFDNGKDLEGCDAAHERRIANLKRVESTQPSTITGLLALARHMHDYLTDNGSLKITDETDNDHALVALLRACRNVEDTMRVIPDYDWGRATVLHLGFVPYPASNPFGLVRLDTAIPQEARRLLALAEQEFERRRRAYVGFHDPTVWPRVAASLRREMRMDALALAAADLPAESSSASLSEDRYGYAFHGAMTNHRLAHLAFAESVRAADCVAVRQAGGDDSDEAMAPLEAARDAANEKALQAWRDLFKIRPRTLHHLWLLLQHVAEHFDENSGIEDEPDVFGALVGAADGLRFASREFSAQHDLSHLSILELEVLNDLCRHQGRTLSRFSEMPCAEDGPLGTILKAEGTRFSILGDMASEEIERRVPADDNERNLRLETLIRSHLAGNGYIEPDLLNEAVAAWAD